LELQSPSLSAAQFEKLLVPFLDRQLLYARETEYRLTCSIFAPMQDALDRSALEVKEIDFCLLVGGSSLIPQVAHAVAEFFTGARVLTYPDRESVQVAVARGAAWHSLALTLFGRGLFQVVAHDRIAIGTATGAYELIPKGSPLPYPDKNGWATTLGLAVPDTSLLESVDLLVEILAGDKARERTLFTTTWEMPAPIGAGDKLRLDYRIDENQVFHFKLTLADSPDAEPFAGRVESPFSNVVNPNARRLKIQKAEEALRTGHVPSERIPDTIVEIARDYAELNQCEKAISYLNRALLIKNQPDPDILNLLGIYNGALGDEKKEEKCYRECARVSTWAAPLFNLALAFKNRRKFSDALETVRECLLRRRDGPTFTLQATIADGMKDDHARDDALREALACFAGPRGMNDWELGWYHTAARMSGDKKRLDEATAEQKRRKEVGGAATVPDGHRPILSPTLATR
jgi:molecular chaperone DnaK (HSP70)